MLRDKVILFDDSCPMCRLYTWWFVAWGFLKPEHRISFSLAPAEITTRLDLNRARHEIPLFDRSSRETVYGLEALTLVLASRWRWLSPVFRTRCFYYLFHPLYQVITYNRRVISGCAACSGFDCAPDLNRFYRSVYIGMAASLAAITCAALISATSPLRFAATSLIAACCVLAALSGTITRFSAGSVAGWDHVGNSVTVILMVSIALIPVAVVPAMHDGAIFCLIAFAGALGVLEFRRRRLWG